MPEHHLKFAQDLYTRYFTNHGVVWFNAVPREGIGRSTIDIRWTAFNDLLKQKLVEAGVIQDNETIQVEYSFIAWHQTPVALDEEPLNFKWSGEIVFTIRAGNKYVTLVFEPACEGGKFYYSHTYESYHKGQSLFWFCRETMVEDGVEMVHQNFVKYIVKYFQWVQRNRD